MLALPSGREASPEPDPDVLPEAIGYARIGSFSTTTPRELDETLNALKVDGDILQVAGETIDFPADDALKVVERILHFRVDPRFARVAAELYLERGSREDGLQALRPGSLAEALQSGNPPPAWLQPIPTGGAIHLYRIR